MNTRVTHQQTINKPVSIKGVGLHTGQEVTLTLKPAPPRTGVQFVRTDLPNRPVIPALVENLVDLSQSPRRTSVGINGVEIHTIEHLMASLWGLNIHNVFVEINAEELPGMDGSAVPFVQALRDAGINPQTAPATTFYAREPIWVEDSARRCFLAVLPSSELRVSYMLSYDHPLLHAQYASFGLSNGVFESDIAPSRTFCLQREADELRKLGLGKGATYENTLVLGNDGVIDNNLRFENEFARHKVLDLLGDLSLLGFNLVGHIVAIRSGHPLNIQFIQKVASAHKRSRDAALYPGKAQPGATAMDINVIKRILPHRYPFLLVDRITEIDPLKRAVGIKNVTINDNFFAGHFPGRPVMPGVMIIEALAQVAGVLLLNSAENSKKFAYFASVSKGKFRRTVVPGDQLFLEVDVLKIRPRTGLVYGKALVDGKVVAEAELMFSLVDG
ncbi:MAG: bifunctional UDP-3-O-[3-hydroxymyristoyl] N-acetylglucosamine deacetylase/3-hydroxyacyl-ACP dehydratase [Candidatus Omnitrophica bacterium]|nr:bifunctional UDP-3-O-[3-hydroxymyristoyl] N-acetylglucosamine deacetylase/3-hydroxyacyl-ACP dehydratase [Candidatus Omnitrophota bacterium]